jgi:6-phosphogluconolactonase
MPDVRIFSDHEALATAAADLFVETTASVVAEQGSCRVVLAGGSTPLALYNLLSSEPYSEQIAWDRLHIFFGDERSVPPDHPESNYRKAHQSLISRVPLLPENIHRIPAELSPERAADVYEEKLLAYFSSQIDTSENGSPSFDLVLLGMGDDGHTASLFPGSPAIREESRWVAAYYVDKLAAWRITLTPAILNRAGRVLFLVAGAGKRDTLQRVIYGSYQPERYPAQIIQPGDNRLTWLVDEAAASLF